MKIEHKMKIKTIELDECDWYHRTMDYNIEKIEKEGFKLPPPNTISQYTNGIYFLNNPDHPRIQGYGNVEINACVKGNFIDASNEMDWWNFIDPYYKIHNEMEGKQLVDLILETKPDVDGVKIGGLGKKNEMLVVWKPEVITRLKTSKRKNGTFNFYRSFINDILWDRA